MARLLIVTNRPGGPIFKQCMIGMQKPTAYATPSAAAIQTSGHEELAAPTASPGAPGAIVSEIGTHDQIATVARVPSTHWPKDRRSTTANIKQPARHAGRLPSPISSRQHHLVSLSSVLRAA
jgi:hypothetical protein